MSRTFEIGDVSQAPGACLNALAIVQALFGAGKRLVTIAVSEKKRSNPANDHFHGQIDDIYQAMKSAGSKRSAHKWKRALVEQFVYENQDLGWEEVGVFPSLDGKRVVQCDEPTRKFSVSQSRAFTEWLYAFGAERGVSFRVDRRLAREAEAA